MFDPKELLEKERSAVTNDITDTLSIMTYELGAIAQNVIYAQTALDEKERNSLHANALLEVCDMIAQCAVISEKLKEASPNMQFQPTWEQMQDVAKERVHTHMDILINKTSRRDPSLSD